MAATTSSSSLSSVPKTKKFHSGESMIRVEAIEWPSHTLLDNAWPNLMLFEEPAVHFLKIEEAKTCSWIDWKLMQDNDCAALWVYKRDDTEDAVYKFRMAVESKERCKFQVVMRDFGGLCHYPFIHPELRGQHGDDVVHITIVESIFHSGSGSIGLVIIKRPPRVLGFYTEPEYKEWEGKHRKDCLQNDCKSIAALIPFMDIQGALQKAFPESCDTVRGWLRCEPALWTGGRIHVDDLGRHYVHASYTERPLIERLSASPIPHIPGTSLWWVCGYQAGECLRRILELPLTHITTSCISLPTTDTKLEFKSVPTNSIEDTNSGTITIKALGSFVHEPGAGWVLLAIEGLEGWPYCTSDGEEDNSDLDEEFKEMDIST